MTEAEALDLIHRRCAAGDFPPVVLEVWSGTAPRILRGMWRKPRLYFESSAAGAADQHLEALFPELQGLCPLFELVGGSIGLIGFAPVAPARDRFVQCFYEDMGTPGQGIDWLGEGFQSLLLHVFKELAESGLTEDYDELFPLLRFERQAELEAWMREGEDG